MAVRAGTVWVEVGGDHLQASRINEISGSVPGQLALRVTGHREPVVVALDGVTDPTVTTAFADRLLALIERHSRPRTAGTVIGFRPAGGATWRAGACSPCPAWSRSADRPWTRTPLPRSTASCRRTRSSAWPPSNVSALSGSSRPDLGSAVSGQRMSAPVPGRPTGPGGAGPGRRRRPGRWGTSAACGPGCRHARAGTRWCRWRPASGRRPTPPGQPPGAGGGPGRRPGPRATRPRPSRATALPERQVVRAGAAQIDRDLAGVHEQAGQLSGGVELRPLQRLARLRARVQLRQEPGGLLRKASSPVTVDGSPGFSARADSTAAASTFSCFSARRWRNALDWQPGRSSAAAAPARLSAPAFRSVRTPRPATRPSPRPADRPSREINRARRKTGVCAET
ncbi:hypothetical protein ABIA33_004980 [Streptacidiphilus sp. MAP12-16]